MVYRMRICTLSLLIVASTIAALVSPVMAETASDISEDVRWIWSPKEGAPPVPTTEIIHFRKVITLPPQAEVEMAHLIMTVDDSAEVFVNGKPSGKKKSS